MARSILLEEFHLTFLAPGQWSEERRRSAVRILRSREFRRRLQEVIREFLAHHVELVAVRWRLDR